VGPIEISFVEAIISKALTGLPNYYLKPSIKSINRETLLQVNTKGGFLC
jgi:hypothetical protein